MQITNRQYSLLHAFTWADPAVCMGSVPVIPKIPFQCGAVARSTIIKPGLFDPALLRGSNIPEYCEKQCFICPCGQGLFFFHWSHSEFVPQTAHEVLGSHIKMPCVQSQHHVFFSLQIGMTYQIKSAVNKREHLMAHQWRHALFPPWLALLSSVHQRLSEDSGCLKIKAHNRGMWSI